MKTIVTPVLEIAYEERGPANGPAVVLLHGWPDDIRTWDGVVARLVERGYRTFTPYLRGYGPTRFLDATTPRYSQNAALAQDAADFLVALDLRDVLLVGHDWGSRCVYFASLIVPERVRAVVALATTYGSNMPSHEMDVAQVRAYWYQWFFNLERGRNTLEKDRRSLCRYLWRMWSPGWNFSDEEFERTAASWDNPDFVPITIHSYRHRWGNAPDDPRYDALQRRILEVPPIPVPVTALFGADDGATLLASTEVPASRFAAGYVRRVVPGAGHFIQRERPELVAEAVLESAR